MREVGRKRLLQALRLVVCVVALVWVLRQLSWRSTVTLRTGQRCVLLEQRDDVLVVESDGRRRELSSEAVKPRSAADRRPDVRYGVKDVVHSLDWPLAILGLAVFAPCPVAIAVRLKWLLDAQRIRLTYWEAVKITYAGNFLNFAFPGLTGGDVVKAYYVAKHTDLKHEAVAVVFFDRVLGLACLVGLGGAMVLIGWKDPAVTGFGRDVGILALILVVGATIYFSRRVRGLLRYERWIERIPLGPHVRRLDQAAFLYRGHKSVLLRCASLTWALQIVSVVAVFFGGWALRMVGESPGGALVPYLLYIPLGWLIGAVPISPQGLGVMEAAYIHFFVHSAKLANSESQAFFLAMIGRLIQMAWALPGLWIVFTGAYRPTSEKAALAASSPHQAGPDGA